MVGYRLNILYAYNTVEAVPQAHGIFPRLKKKVVGNLHKYCALWLDLPTVFALRINTLETSGVSYHHVRDYLHLPYPNKAFVSAKSQPANTNYVPQTDLNLEYQPVLPRYFKLVYVIVKLIIMLLRSMTKGMLF